MTTEGGQAETVLLRLEVNRANCSMNSPVIMRLRNARAFNEGEDDGFENKAERSRDKSASHQMMNISRAGKNDRRLNTAGPEGNRVISY